MLMFFLGLAFHYIYIIRRTNTKSKYFDHLYANMKDTPVGKSFTLEFVMRRLILAICVVVMIEFLSKTTVPVMNTLIHFMAFVYIVLSHPFKQKTDNLIETMNECQITVISSFFIFYRSKEEWSDVLVSGIIFSLILNNIIIAIINICMLIKKCCCKSKSKGKVIGSWAI